MILNKKKAFYKDLRASGMMGNYWNKAAGSPEIRSECISSFCEMKGFSLLLETLEKTMVSDGLLNLDSEDIRIILQALFEARASVEDTVVTRISILAISHFTRVSDATLKKESTDTVGAALILVRRLTNSATDSSDIVNQLWLRITCRYLESASLPLRLFGLEQLSQIVNCARASRPFPLRYRVQNGGTSVVNGIYELKKDDTPDCTTDTASYVMLQPNTKQTFTLFCCTMKSGSKWWFISEADPMQPGSNQDIDYYQNECIHESSIPPMCGWTPTGKGEYPAPEVVADGVGEPSQDAETKAKRFDFQLSKWVYEKRIIEELFGDRIHREVVSRSAQLIKFLAESRELDVRSLNAIWSASLQKDQALVDEIHGLLITTVPFLETRLLLHLILVVKNSLENRLNRDETSFPELLSFLESLAAALATGQNGQMSAFLQTQQVVEAILDLLWLIQLHTDVGHAKLSARLRDFFSEEINSKFGEMLRKKFLGECIEGIKRSSLEMSQIQIKDEASRFLELLQSLLDTYNPAERALTVELLNNEHDLALLLFDELASYVNRIPLKEKDHAPYRSAISRRLLLIHYIHAKSPTLQLNVEQIDRLWKILSNTPSEQEVCLSFFNQLSRGTLETEPKSTNLELPLSVDVCWYIFDELLCKQADFHELTCIGYKCFHSYFLGLNGDNKKSLKDTSGLDALWRLALEAPTDVSELAIKELLTVYDHFGVHEDHTHELGVQEDFLRRVFETLNDVRDLTINDSMRLVKHSIHLLSGLVAAAPLNVFTPHGLTCRGATFNIKVLVQRLPGAGGGTATPNGQDGGGQSMHSTTSLEVEVYENQKLWQLRKHLELLVQHPLQQSKILMGGYVVGVSNSTNTLTVGSPATNLAAEEKTLRDLGIGEANELRLLLFQNSIVSRTPEYTSQIVPPSVRKRHPGLVIAEKLEYFDILFRISDLLREQAIDSEISEEVIEIHHSLWDFLQQLPTNSQIFRLVSSIGLGEDGDVVMSSPNVRGSISASAPWSSLLSMVPYHQAIYTLQIVDSLLRPCEGSITIEMIQSFRSRFISAGGFRQIMHLVLSTRIDVGTKKGDYFFNEGVVVGLRIIQFCLFDSALSRERLHEILVNQVDHEALVDKLAEVIVSEYSKTISNSTSSNRTLIDAIKMVGQVVAEFNASAEKFCDVSPVSDILATVLLSHHSVQVRESWCTTLSSVCQASLTNRNRRAFNTVWEKMIESVDQIEEISIFPDQYFGMFRILVEMNSSNSASASLVAKVLRKLRIGFSTKFVAGNEYFKHVLTGQLEILRLILEVHDDKEAALARDIMDVVYEDCLFTLPSSNFSPTSGGRKKTRPICTTVDTRRTAFKLLAMTIIKDTRVLKELEVRLSTGLFEKCGEALKHRWGQDSHVEPRGSGEHVGLKNQGCSCYMNSFLQQLFMNPHMRRGLLAAEVPPRPNSSVPTKHEVELSPEKLVGCRVAIEYLGGRVYEAKVIAYEDATGRHTIRYDENGAEASFILSEGRPGHENGRYAILEEELSKEEATLEVLRQIQKTFCFLRDSEVRFFNPKALVEACKCLNLEFSVYQQNDASEFCDKLLDRLEIGLKKTPQGHKCLQQLLGGKLLSQKRFPKDCGHKYEREEAFIRLELQIRGKESIEESLQSFIEAEVMDGDNKVECEKCATKKAAVRRTCFGTLPNLLILHLKRFDLDYTTFETVKLNNRCSFPIDLNMKPYTKVGLEEEEKLQEQRTDDTVMFDTDNARMENGALNVPSQMKELSESNDEDGSFIYRLKGILVHSGVAQGGHYYSFIFDNESEKWFRFDDEDVSPFDPSQIEAECFGGVQKQKWPSSNSGGSNGSISGGMEMEVFINALMLFYEKIELSPTEFFKDLVSISNPFLNEYEAEVWKANEAFLQNSYLFDVELHEFLREMVQFKVSPAQGSRNHSPKATSNISPPAAPHFSIASLGNEEEMQASLARIGVNFMLSVLLHSREKHGVARWISALTNKFSKNCRLCYWFFQELSTTKREVWLRNLLLECPDSIARQSFVHLLSRAVNAYEGFYDKQQDPQDNQQQKSVYIGFVDTLIELFDNIAHHHQAHLEEMFMLMRNFAENSVVMRDYMRSKDVIARLVLFFMGDRAPQVLKQAFSSTRLVASALVSHQHHYPDCQYLLEAIICILGMQRRVPEPLLISDVGNANSYSQRSQMMLTEKAERALTDVFEQFQIDGVLSEEQLKKYFRSCSSTSNTAAIAGNWNGGSSAVDQRVRLVFSKYATAEEPPRLELDGFLAYYTDIARSSSKNVLMDLRAIGFGDDFTRQKKELVPGAVFLSKLNSVSRGSLLNEAFFVSSLEEDAEVASDLLLKISVGDRTLSTLLLRSLVQCYNNAEQGWKGQPVVDACGYAMQQLICFPSVYQSELIEMALMHPEIGLITAALKREKTRQKYVSSNHVSLFIFRHICLILDLYAYVPIAQQWLDSHRQEWSWMFKWLRAESLQQCLGGRMATLYREPAKLDALYRLGDALKVPFQEEERNYIVEGAGFEPVNGIYKSTNQTHDGCPIYVCPKEDIEYILFRCRMPSKARRWYISYSPNKNLLGTMSDEDYYFVPCHLQDESPPEVGWKVWVKNPKTSAPPPTVRLYTNTGSNVRSHGLLEEEEHATSGTIDNGEVDADTVEYDDSEEEIRASNERFQAVNLDNQED
jgi:ubiquitin carboxyl-terminal hydrolase 9/24